MSEAPRRSRPPRPSRPRRPGKPPRLYTAHETARERALGYGASFLELGFGFLQFFLDPNRQTVHDRIAHTIVVTERGGPPREA